MILDRDIMDYLRREDRSEGVKRLKQLCHAVMIRRPASIIELPPRQDLTKVVDFSEDEKCYYEVIESSLQKLPDDAIEAHAGDGRIWMSVIQMINKLRLFCNLGVVSKPATLAAPQHTQYSVTPERDDSTESVVASEFALGGTNCEGCGNMIDVPDKVDSKDASPCAYYTNCSKLFCLDCAILYQSQSVPSCSCDPAIICILHPLSFYVVQKARNGPIEDSAYGPISSKVRAVIEEIQNALPEKR